MEIPVEALRLENITKVYPNGVVANNKVNLSVNKGEIHALSGENGAGKTTLMKILFGEEEATEGKIFVNNKQVSIKSPLMAIALGIGFVHQHFMLVPSLTVAENILLGIEPMKGIGIDENISIKTVEEASRKFNFAINPRQKISELTVGQKQKVEILKALVRGVSILILDEPTAVLTPQETKELFSELISLRNQGFTIIFISHKLNEVKEICDRITIIRKGKTVGIYNIEEISEQEISNKMVGRDVTLKITKSDSKPGKVLLDVKNLKTIDENGLVTLDNVSFTVRTGEILGVAGVEGNGQLELSQTITGISKFQSGSIHINGTDISNLSIQNIRSLGVSHISEDRMKEGIAPHISITGNLVADKIHSKPFSRYSILNLKEIDKYGNEMVERYKIVCKSPQQTINSLSGGNIQKVVLAREMSSNPKLLIADQPTRGVDVGASEFIRKEIVASRENGNSIFLISSDLNEILGLSDAIIVLFKGKISAYFSNTKELTEEILGRYMLGIDKQTDSEIAEAYYEQ